MQQLLVGHLPKDSCEFWLASGDCAVSAGAGALHLAHSQVLALQSPHLAELCSLALSGSTASSSSGDEADTVAWRGRTLPVVRLLPRSGTPPELAAAAPHLADLLAAMYAAAGPPRFEWACLPSVLALADYLGASGTLARADAWLCEQCRTQGATDRLQSLLCDAFELAARHRLGSAMALLLPYATQALARGSRALSAVWYDGKQRCCRLRAAFDDASLKSLALDAFWWARDAQAPCPTCRCMPADIAAAWDQTREWVGGRDASTASGARAGLPPDVYARSVRHYAHVLREACWAVTPTTAAVAGGTALQLPPCAP